MSQLYSQLLEEAWEDSDGWSIPLQMACLDTLMLGATMCEEVESLMGVFTEMVADDSFVDGIDQPLAQWAIVICLWLRRVSQVCSALGASMKSTYTERLLKHSKEQVHPSSCTP